MRKINFFSGPAILPQVVLDQAQAAIADFDGMGLSILEISHRSPQFIRVMEEARALVRELMGLTDEYEVLFLQGGASSQFHMIPYNLLNATETAGYFDTGQWAHGAMTEAGLFGQVDVIASSRDSQYDHIPHTWDLSRGPYKYIHLTTNNTIYGTQWSIDLLKQIRAAAPCLVADMSSDIFSRHIDYTDFDLIYAGAQKNMGAAGTTMVALKRSLLGTVSRPIPGMLDYSVHIAQASMRNTPSVFAVYVTYLTLRWIQSTGLDQIYAANQRKASKLYAAIDSSAVFRGTVAHADRSMMNVCFFANDRSLEPRFMDYARQYGIEGIAGYRTVGGFRASIYNAMTEAGVDTLIEAMNAFERAL